jgi:hypothetical protein
MRYMQRFAAHFGKHSTKAKPCLSVVMLVVLCPLWVQGQASPTAIQSLHISGFMGVTGVSTGLASGRNVGLTAGIDVGPRSFAGLRPFFELRGTYPVDKGKIDSEKSVLGGLKLGKAYGRVIPYVDALFGRGQTNYTNGYADPQRAFAYFQSVSNILSVGGGVDLSLSEHLAIKADLQGQRFSSPVSDSGHVFPKLVTLGVVYRLTSGPLGRRWPR